MSKQKAITLAEAKSQYPHRYTMEHVPRWALRAAPNGKFCAPLFTTDKEWFDNTLFPPNHPLGAHVHDCYSTCETWPLGQWLNAPYDRKTGWVIPRPQEQEKINQGDDAEETEGY